MSRLPIGNAGALRAVMEKGAGGWGAIPGGKKGGRRRRKGKGWQYDYGYQTPKGPGLDDRLKAHKKKKGEASQKRSQEAAARGLEMAIESYKSPLEGMSDNFDFGHYEERAKGMSKVGLQGAIEGILEALPEADAMDREMKTSRGGKYRDEISVYRKELAKRKDDPKRGVKKRLSIMGAGAKAVKLREAGDKEGLKKLYAKVQAARWSDADNVYYERQMLSQVGKEADRQRKNVDYARKLDGLLNEIRLYSKDIAHMKSTTVKSQYTVPLQRFTVPIEALNKGGWGAIPKGKKGGQRKRVGAQWIYRYPDGKGGWSGSTSSTQTSFSFGGGGGGGVTEDAVLDALAGGGTTVGHIAEVLTGHKKGANTREARAARTSVMVKVAKLNKERKVVFKHRGTDTFVDLAQGYGPKDADSTWFPPKGSDGGGGKKPKPEAAAPRSERGGRIKPAFQPQPAAEAQAPEPKPEPAAPQPQGLERISLPGGKELFINRDPGTLKEGAMSKEGYAAGDGPYQEGDVLHPDHKDEASAYVIDDYPYGRDRTQMRVWIETDKKGKQRMARQTQNPKTGRWNNPKKSTYSDGLVGKFDENGHIKQHGISVAYRGEGSIPPFLQKYGGHLDPQTIAMATAAAAYDAGKEAGMSRDEAMKAAHDMMSKLAPKAEPKPGKKAKAKSDPALRFGASPDAYSEQFSKDFKKLKKVAGIKSIKQGYKGTGSKSHKRQLFVRFDNGDITDVWFEGNAVNIGGVYNPTVATISTREQSTQNVAQSVASALTRLRDEGHFKR